MSSDGRQGSLVHWPDEVQSRAFAALNIIEVRSLSTARPFVVLCFCRLGPIAFDDPSLSPPTRSLCLAARAHVKQVCKTLSDAPLVLSGSALPASARGGRGGYKNVA
eukprot:4985914-Pleurochrysis_carterae.AAC.1